MRSLVVTSALALSVVTAQGCATDDRQLEVSLPHCEALLTCCTQMTSLTSQESCFSDVTRLEANQADATCADELAVDQRAMPPLCP